MTIKPTYEELEKKIKDIDKKALQDRCAEDALRESEVRLKTVLDTVQAGIIVIDPKTHVIVGVNAAAGKMVGAPREQILGSVCHKYICPAEEGQCPATDLGENLDNAELELLAAGGKRVPILKTVVPVMLAGREHLLESFLDITERKRAEADLRESEKKIYENQKRMEILKFSNDVSLNLMHEIRNPLVAIGGYSRLISRKDYSENKIKEFAGIILEQSIRLEEAVDKILAHLKGAADQA